jgi:ATP-binding cassette subfamily A (ABC1) protein 3
MKQKLENISLQDKLLSCLFPNMGLHWAIKAMYSFETRGVGANWKTAFQPTSPIDGFALYHVIIMFIIDTIVFMALTIYLENVLPSKYGLRKPWYYIFQKSTWWDTEDPKALERRRSSLAVPIERPGFEKEPVGLPVGVAIQNLRKIFGKKRAVDGVSMKMYEGQITALLGHNGAGKTTTLSILTGIENIHHKELINFNIYKILGLYPPSGGTASVNGYDIRSEMDRVRDSLGLCTQHNMLYEKYFFFTFDL